MTLQLLGLHRKVGPTLPIRKVLDSCEKTRKPFWLWFDIFVLRLDFFRQIWLFARLFSFVFLFCEIFEIIYLKYILIFIVDRSTEAN